ncbi:MAG TPA: zinc-finger domain-containing protein [Candidatus Omnitrophota bacterium]|nr:zinc-finger domain-containing protein [Candidatus Omnitrophota bacterium]
MTARVEDPATPAATASTEPQVVHATTVACDGNGPALGHPRVFLSFGNDHEIVCPYCSRRFVLAEGAKGHH